MEEYSSPRLSVHAKFRAERRPFGGAANTRPAARGTGISVPVYLCTSSFVWANSVKPDVCGTYQKIPGTGHLELSIL